LLDLELSEAADQATIVDLAKTLRWTVFHVHDSRAMAEGFPDLLLIRPPQLVFLEVKAENGRATPAQMAVLALLRRCPQVTALLVRPSDWEAVKRLLTRSGPPSRSM